MAIRSRSAGKTTIKIPTPLYERLSLLIEGAGYNSVTDFIVYVLRDLAGERELEATRVSQEALTGAAREPGREPTDVASLRKTWSRELERAKRKLKGLGYL